MPENETFLSIENNIETPIHNLDELKKHIQFLFRTDAPQEWTTDKTKDDWVTFPLFDEESLSFEDDENRKSLANILSDSVTVFLAGEDTQLVDSMVDNYVYSFTLTKVDSNNKISSIPFDEDERNFVIGQFIQFPYADLLSLVCHRDYRDGCERLHGLFVWTPGELNRIMAILNPETDEEESYDEDVDSENNNGEEETNSELER